MNNSIYKTQLLSHFAAMKTHPLFISMSNTVEGSPWHREANVLVHTEMVVDEYIKLVDALDRDWTHSDFMGGLCCVWHDTGKPAARTPKHSEERGDYFAFHGHELISARLFEDYFMHNRDLLSKDNIFYVEWMIHYHMPWSIKDPHKLSQLKASCLKFGGLELYQAYTRALLADQFGRIADAQEEKNRSALEWVENLNNTPDTITPVVNRRVEANRSDVNMIFFPIGPSGAGKSTLFKNYVSTMLGRKCDVYSLDLLRHQYYHPTDYAVAYQNSVDDKSFESRAKQEFMRLVKDGNGDIYVDNTNLSTKRRAFFIDEARKRGYLVCAFHLTSDLDTLIQRQLTRVDKTVPEAAVRQQYFALTVPSIGEFDIITVV